MKTSAALIALAAMFATAAPAHSAPVDVFDRLLIEDLVIEALAVPEGALVEDIVAVQGAADGQQVICGRVNAKAVNGEYMGFLDFTGLLATVPGQPALSAFTRLRIGSGSCPATTPASP
jgi:hypothetical protein